MPDKNGGSEGKPKPEDDTLDIGSLFRGTATITFLVEVVTAIMMLGSGVAFIISRSGLLEMLEGDVLVFLFLLGSMTTLFFFLGTISFFVRVNRKIGRTVFWEGVGQVDLSNPRVRTVVLIYGLAVGLVLVMGMYGYWLVWKYFFEAMAATSLSVFGFAVSLGGFVVAFLVQLVVAAVGRTASKVVRTVLAGES
ncbi:hypothetical protein EU524_02075 [Candidatus Thorarchaeota archaeon]|nr:MAG: hypothetical protein EU524_02075 [Candidatus Thorarchaeota archaeon]